MNQFERYRSVDRQLDFRIQAAAGAIHEQYERRTEPLPASIDEVVANFRDYRFAGIEQS